MPSLYDALVSLGGAPGTPTPPAGDAMQVAAVSSVRDDGFVVVTGNDGRSQIAAPINDGPLEAGMYVWVSGAANGPSVIHGPRY